MRAGSAAADVVLNVADCDDVALTGAVLDGMRARFAATGRRPVLVHTSGTGVIMDNAHGVLDPALAAAPYDVRARVPAS